jgi:Mrp family chromosome partitioning ATPase
MTKGMWESAFTQKREGEPDGQASVEENGDDMLLVDHCDVVGNSEGLLPEGPEDARRLQGEALSGEEPSSEQSWKGVLLGVPGSAQGGPSVSSMPVEGPQVQLSLDEPSASEMSGRTPPILAKMNQSLNSIWTNLLMKSTPLPRTILFCGATQGEGVSFISFHFSLFLSLGLHLRVLYLDTDVEKRSPCPYLPAMEEGRGLVSFFDERFPLRSLVASTQFENLWVLPAGVRKSSSQPQGFVYVKEALGELVDFCQRHFDVAIFDGQPILWSPATVAFAHAVDRVLLICRYGYSRREVSKLAIERLRENEVEVAGVILNDRQYPIPQRLYKKMK